MLAAQTEAGAADSGGSVPPQPIQRPPGPPDPGFANYEGDAVAGSSRFLVIGRPGATVESSGTNIARAGKVVVWELDESYLVDDLVKKRFWVIDALNPVAYHYFGTAVAAGDRWIAVTGGQGGFGTPDGSPPKTNHVQLIEFPPDGGWLPGPELPGPADSVFRKTALFGMSLAMHHDRLVVGSLLGALVYEVDSAGVWTRTQILTTNSTVWHNLGMAVAIHQDLIAVGAPGSPTTETNGLIAGQGGVILYRRGPNGLYTVEKELRVDSVDPGTPLNARDAFGTSVALEARGGIEWLAAGAPGRDARFSANNLQPDAGCAFLFRRTLPDGEWVFHQAITNDSINGNLTQRAKSGTTIALSNGRLAVGAVSPGGTQNPSSHGVVRFYYYDEAEDRWIRTGEKQGNGSQNYGHGLHGFTEGFLIGSPNFSANGVGATGAWEWRPTDPYVAFINSGGGPNFGGRPAHDRRGDVDPDGDGILNSDELFFGSDPLVANTNRVIAPVIDTAAQQFKLQWQQASNTFGLTSKVAWSTNMATWVTNDLQIVSLGPVPNAAARRFEARLPLAGRTNVFFRLLVE
jgi:hypothetical protein